MKKSKSKLIYVLLALAVVISMVPVLTAPQPASAQWDPVDVKSTTGIQDSDCSTWLLKHDMLEVIKVGANGVIDPPDPTKPYYIGGDDEIVMADESDSTEKYLLYIGLGYPFGTNGRFSDGCDGLICYDKDTIYIRAWNGGAGSYSATFEECIVNATHYGNSETWLVGNGDPSCENPPWIHDFGTWCTDQPKPVAGFTIQGDVYEADGTTPYNDPLVIVKNTTTGNGDTWDATIDPPSGNHYTLTLTGGDIPSAGNIMRILARKGSDITGEDTIGYVDYTVTAGDLAANGFTEDVTLNHYYLNWPTYPYSVWEDPPGDPYSGPAVMQMCLEHYGVPMTQDALYTEGIANNESPETTYVDPKGMERTLDAHSGGHNYSVGVMGVELDAINRMAYWQYLGPGVVPAYGGYHNWMAIRGIHTDENPTDSSWASPNYTVYGFWFNDPNPEGIGENSYKTAGQWMDTYYDVIDDPDYEPWNGKYITVLEPPEDDSTVTNRQVIIAASPARFDRAIEPVQMGKVPSVASIRGEVSVTATRDNEVLNKVVQAAKDGVAEQLNPYDAEFAEVFARTVAGEPLLVSDEGGDYYLVPFNEPQLKVQLAPWNIRIERLVTTSKAIEIVRAIGDRSRIQPTPIEPILLDEQNTLVVVIVDAEDGSFQEASWVAEAVKYLRVSKSEALRLVCKELGVQPFAESAVSIELVGTDGSPYQPDWKVTIDGKVFFVDQDGNVRN